MAFERKDKESKPHKPKKKHYYTDTALDDDYHDFDEDIYYDSRDKGNRKPRKKRSQHFEY